jgi:hypothetical protein
MGRGMRPSTKFQDAVKESMQFIQVNICHLRWLEELPHGSDWLERHSVLGRRRRPTATAHGSLPERDNDNNPRRDPPVLPARLYEALVVSRPAASGKPILLRRVSGATRNGDRNPQFGDGTPTQPASVYRTEARKVPVNTQQIAVRLQEISTYTTSGRVASVG